MNLKNDEGQVVVEMKSNYMDVENINPIASRESIAIPLSYYEEVNMKLSQLKVEMKESNEIIFQMEQEKKESNIKLSYLEQKDIESSMKISQLNLLLHEQSLEINAIKQMILQLQAKM